MKKYTMYFKSISVGDKFHKDGTNWEKKSSRTAFITDEEYEGKWFYFSMTDIVEIML